MADDTGEHKDADEARYQGYEALYNVDVYSGRCMTHGIRLLVPSSLATVVNAARERLRGRRVHDASAWREAGVIPAFELRPDGAELTSDPCAQPAGPATRAPAAMPAPSAKAPGPPPAEAAPARPRLPPGRRVKVISTARISARRQEVELRTKFSAEEKKTELKMLDALLARGGARVVGMPKCWRVQLATLRADMPHFTPVIDRIEACLALAEFTRTPARLPPILLAGTAGVGKTLFATRLAAVMGVPQFVYAMESAETTSVLSGAEKHWSNSEAGQLWKLVVLGEYANPVVVLDELDKSPRGTNHYKPASALHALLERVTAGSLRDKSVDMEFDASWVTYVATANRLSSIEASLLSRFELFHVEEPGPRASVAIARSICRAVLGELKLEGRFTVPAAEVVQQMALLGGPRQMHRAIRAGLGRAVLAGRSSVTVADLFGGAPCAEAGGGDDRMH